MNASIDGIQVDREPYVEPYRTSLQSYVKAVAGYLRDENSDPELNCRFVVFHFPRKDERSCSTLSKITHDLIELCCSLPSRRNKNHPTGRTVAYFTFAHNHQPSFTTEVLGANGYYVFSGYDLFPKDDKFTYNTVEEFASKLRREITYMKPVLGETGKFTLALPFGASCHEYEEYVPMKGDGCGPACEGGSLPTCRPTTMT